jgi:adenosylcobinamide-phosphate synthase
LAKQRTKKAFKIGWRDGIIASYGNSAIPIAAFAGALGLRLGGRNTYKGIIVKKPFLGEPGRSFDNGAIMESIRLMQDTEWMALMLCIMIHLIFT